MAHRIAGDVLLVNKHIKFLLRCLDVMPARYCSYDTNRLAVTFFAISGLDMLQSLDELSAVRKEEIIDWIYSLQVLPDATNSNESRCGFRGSSTIGNAYNPSKSSTCDAMLHDSGHIAMTYTGLACLLILGDDLSRVNRSAIMSGLRALQLPDGSFCATMDGSENDMRFVFCATAVCYMLQDWSGIDMDRAANYIKNSLAYDCGIGQGPGLEAHGGSTYCAIAALTLMNRLASTFTRKEIYCLQRWCLLRQQSGFQGRPNKPEDTCYSFWVGAVLEMLGVLRMVDFESNREFILSTQGAITGGLSKWPDTTPATWNQTPKGRNRRTVAPLPPRPTVPLQEVAEAVKVHWFDSCHVAVIKHPLHTYLGLCGLALMGEDDLRPAFPALNISLRATEHLHTLHKSWKEER